MSDCESDYIVRNLRLQEDIEQLLKENAELRAKLFKAEIERGVMFEEYDKVRAKLDAWEKQSPIGYVCKCEDYTGSIISDYKEWDDYSTPLFTKPKEA